MSNEVGEVSLKTEIVGDFHVTIQEKITESKKIGALVTIHDIGLNCESYQNFLKNEDNSQFLDKFLIYHIEIPGQHKGAEQLSPDYQFPSLSRMADKLVPVLNHFQLNDVIGLGVGAGAVILIHLAIVAPDRFLGITVIDAAGKSTGFKEWGEQKLATYSLEKKGFTSSAEKFLIWHLFGTKGKKNINMDMVDECLKNITTHQNPYNLSQYVKAYMQRSDVMKEVQDKLKCHVLTITSAFSPYKDEAYSFHAKLDRKKSSIIESFESINAFFEDPGKCGEGMLLLMQGCGLVPTLKTRTASRAGPVHRTQSMCDEF